MFLIVHNSLNFNVLPIIKHLLTKIIYRNSCYFGFYPYLCNVIEKTINEQSKINNYDRNINIIRLLVPIHTDNRLYRKTETKQ